MTYRKITSCMFVVLFIFFIGSCNNDDGIISQSSSTETKNTTNIYIPYSDSTTLSVFDSDDNIIDYTLARKLTLLEIDYSGFGDNMNWANATLSQFPVVIYGFDSRPKYYDFIVIDSENSAIGTVQVEARKVSDGLIVELKDTIRDYNMLLNADTTLSLIADWGNNLYRGVIGESGEKPTNVVSTITSSSISTRSSESSDTENLEELTDEEIVEELYKTLQEAQDTIGSEYSDLIQNDSIRETINNETNNLDVEAQRDSLIADMEEAHNQSDIFWDEVESEEESVKNMSNEYISRNSTNILMDAFGYTVDTRSSSKYVISKYYSTFNYDAGDYSDATSFWCGPWAMDWIYYTNKSVGDYDYFESWAGKLGLSGIISAISGTKPMFPKEMFYSMLLKTSGSIIVKPTFSLGRKNAYDFIRNKENPVVILTKSGTHWKVGYGTYRSGNWYNRKYYFACQDNGYLNLTRSTTYMKASWIMLFLKVYD